MFIFFGTRSSKVKQAPIETAFTCPYCEKSRVFLMTVFSRYFHIFFLPFLKLGQTTTLECTHCRKTYLDDELQGAVKDQVEQDNKKSPPKRGLFHSCGCLLILLVLVLVTIRGCFGYFFGGDDAPEKEDPRIEALRSDFKKASVKPIDSVSAALKPCVIESLTGIDTGDIRYFAKTSEDRVLILVKVTDMKGVQADTRKELVYAVENCFYATFGGEGRTKLYIGVEGTWNLLMASSPTREDLGGKFASEDILLPFYDTPLKKNDAPRVSPDSVSP